MSNIKEDRKYADTHEWVLDNKDDTYTLGISDFAQESLGDLVFVELPKVGDTFNAKQNMCMVESVKSASDIYAPVSLEIIQINKKLNDTPELVNEDCYNEGWLVKFRAKNIDDLFDSKKYIKDIGLD